MLGLLRQRFSPEEAALYLEPGMLPVFVSALNQLSSEQVLTLTRAFTADGTLIRETLDLPLENHATLSHFRLEKENGAQTIEMTLTTGTVLPLFPCARRDGRVCGRILAQLRRKRRAGGYLSVHRRAGRRTV